MEEILVKKEENRYEYFDLLKVIAMMYVVDKIKRKGEL